MTSDAREHVEVPYGFAAIFTIGTSPAGNVEVRYEGGAERFVSEADALRRGQPHLLKPPPRPRVIVHPDGTDTVEYP